LAELEEPAGALPTASVHAASTVMTFEVSLTPAVGVKVAVKTSGFPVAATAEREPFGAVTLSFVKPSFDQLSSSA
jgi:hypothetical protein